MGQHKHNPTAIAAKNGELPPKKREPRLPDRKMEYLLRLRISQMLDPFGTMPHGMHEIIAEGGKLYD